MPGEHQSKNREAKPRLRRDPIYRVPLGGVGITLPLLPIPGRDKLGLYAILATLVTPGLMPRGGGDGRVRCQLLRFLIGAEEERHADH